MASQAQGRRAGRERGPLVRACALSPNMTRPCMRAASAMSGTLALMTSVSFQLYVKAIA